MAFATSGDGQSYGIYFRKQKSDQRPRISPKLDEVQVAWVASHNHPPSLVIPDNVWYEERAFFLRSSLTWTKLTILTGFGILPAPLLTD